MLYIVATPIGNLGDVTPRALEVLKRVHRVVCEDTRVTRKLLSKYEIHTKTISYFSNSSDTKLEKILSFLEDGEDLAFVTDSGTPAISDPGSKLVSKVREKFSEKVPIISIPGPSALTSALSVSGLPASDFLFLGFLPRKKGRKTLFLEMAGSKRTVVFYESPHRIVKTLEELGGYLEKKREVVIARELTKIYEEVLKGSIDELIELLETDQKKQKGEFVVMVEERSTKFK